MQSSCPKLKVRAAGMDKRKVRRLDMADISLDLQRRFEQRWAARFVRPAAPKKQELERRDQQLTEPDKDKRKTHRIKPASIRSAPAV
jgi:hypothetical protein